MSRLGFGAMGIGHPSWREWVLDDDAGRPIVRRALDAGINLIDTCDYYSNGESEIAIGRMIKDFVKRDEVVLATKSGNPMGKGPNAKGYSRKHIFEAVDASLNRLGTSYIDLYQTHIWDPSTNLGEMVEAFDALVRSGRVGTTLNQKKLFFKLRQAKGRIGAVGEGDMRPDQVGLIAKKIGVAEQDVIDMNRRVGGDLSLSAPLIGDETGPAPGSPARPATAPLSRPAPGSLWSPARGRRLSPPLKGGTILIVGEDRLGSCDDWA